MVVVVVCEHVLQRHLPPRLRQVPIKRCMHRTAIMRIPPSLLTLQARYFFVFCRVHFTLEAGRKLHAVVSARQQPLVHRQNRQKFSSRRFAALLLRKPPEHSGGTPDPSIYLQ